MDFALSLGTSAHVSLFNKYLVTLCNAPGSETLNERGAVEGETKGSGVPAFWKLHCVCCWTWSPARKQRRECPGSREETREAGPV